MRVQNISLFLSLSWSLLYHTSSHIHSHMASQTAQSLRHHSHLLLFSEDSWALFFLLAMAGLPSSSLSLSTYTLTAYSFPTSHRDTDTQHKDVILKRPSFER